MSTILPLISCASEEADLPTSGFDITTISNTLRRLSTEGTAGIAGQTIDKIGLQWQNEGDLEFGHQCGICEDAQGDGDLSRRLVDYAELHDGVIAPNPSSGLTFADLSLSPDTETVWDLTSAVTCKAVEIFYTNVCEQQVREVGKKAEDFLTSLAYHCNQTAPLFIAYLEILMLELAYCYEDDQPRKVIKILRTA